MEPRWDQIEFGSGSLHVRTGKRGTPSTHPNPGRRTAGLATLRARAATQGPPLCSPRHLTAPSHWSRSIGTSGRDVSKCADSVRSHRNDGRWRECDLTEGGLNEAAAMRRNSGPMMLDSRQRRMRTQLGRHGTNVAIWGKYLFRSM